MTGQTRTVLAVDKPILKSMTAASNKVRGPRDEVRRLNRPRINCREFAGVSSAHRMPTPNCRSVLEACSEIVRFRSEQNRVEFVQPLERKRDPPPP